MREHERLTTDFVPRADLVLFVTSADRPFTETERAFLETIRGWGKKIVIVVNKVDIFERRPMLEEVLASCAPRRAPARHHAGDLPGERAPGAARQAAESRRPGRRAASRRSSGSSAETLDERQPVPAEAGQPARRWPGAGPPLCDRSPTSACTLLDDDVALLDDIERQLAVYRGGPGARVRAADDRGREGARRHGGARARSTSRTRCVSAASIDLFNRARIQKEFEERVVADAPRQIERRVSELIDWLIDQDFRQWQAVTSRLAEPRARPALGARWARRTSGRFMPIARG